MYIQFKTCVGVVLIRLVPMNYCTYEKTQTYNVKVVEKAGFCNYCVFANVNW